MILFSNPVVIRFKIGEFHFTLGKFRLTAKVAGFVEVLVVLCLNKIILTGKFSHYSMLSCLG